MIIGIIALCILRLFFWRLFPQLGTGFLSDIVFATISLSAVTLYALSRTRSLLAPWIALWIIAAGLSTITSSSLPTTLGNWVILLTYALLFCAYHSMKKPSETPLILWGVIGFGAILSALIGIWEFYILRTHHFLPGANLSLNIAFFMKRACSLQGWPTAFAGALILTIPGVVFWFKEKPTPIKLFLVLILIAGLLTSVSALPILSLIIAILLITQSKDAQYGTLALCIVFFFVCGTKILDAFFSSRGEYYSAAWNMITQHPFLGGGFGNFRSFGTAKSAFVHNSYVQMWAECGPLGLISLIGLALTFWKMKPTPNDLLQKAVYAGLLAVFIDNLFSFTILKPNLSLIWWLSLAIYSTIWRGKSDGINIRN